MPIDYLAFGYATAVAAGGILGYVKSSEHLSDTQIIIIHIIDIIVIIIMIIISRFNTFTR